jgi:hypothetical protein
MTLAESADQPALGPDGQLLDASKITRNPRLPTRRVHYSLPIACREARQGLG